MTFYAMILTDAAAHANILAGNPAGHLPCCERFGGPGDCVECECARPVYFFDSHGGLWRACSAAEPGAVAFGPVGIARPVTTSEEMTACGVPAYGRGENLVVYDLTDDQIAANSGVSPRTVWGIARAMGLTFEEGEWTFLALP